MPEPSSQPPAELSASTGRWVLFSTILASSMAFIDGSALNVALPALQADLDASAADLLWILNAYLLMLASLILVGGSLGDIFGRKRIFGLGIALFSLSSLACGLAPSAGLLIAARAVQGIGGAMMVPGSLAIISALFPPGRRGTAIGTWSSFSTLTTILGPLLGGYLAGLGLWRGVFLINLPLAALALTVLILKVPESRDESVPPVVDVPGALLAILGLGGITYGFIEVSSRGLADPLVLAGFAGGAIALIAFVIVELNSDHPMVPLGVFQSRTFAGTNLMTLFLYAALSGVSFLVSLNLIQVQQYPEFLAGLAFLPFAVLLSILSRQAGRLADRFGPRLPLIVGASMTGLGFAALAVPGLTNGPRAYWVTFFPGIVIWGLGMSLVVAPLSTAVMGSVSGSRAGVASGVNNAVARTAGVLAIAIMGGIALIAFQGRVAARSAAVDLSPQVRADLQQEALDLGNADVPESTPDPQRETVGQALRLAFVDTFRLIAGIGAGLAMISAVLAGVFVEAAPPES